jgi:hypothetical protein
MLTLPADLSFALDQGPLRQYFSAATPLDTNQYTDRVPIKTSLCPETDHAFARKTDMLANLPIVILAAFPLTAVADSAPKIRYRTGIR